MPRMLNRIPGRVSTVLLGLTPLLVLVLVYLVASDLRLQANPNDKLLPSPAALWQAVERYALTPSPRTGEYLLWTDTAASLTRLGLGLAIAAALGLVFGVLTGLIPLLGATLGPSVSLLSLIPPLAILPLLFIVFGLGETSKVMLIVIGIAPVLIRDLRQRVAELPQELMLKAQTLGGNTWTILLRIALPQMLPRLIDAVRLSLGAAILFLIAAEAIASESGLGYRVFLVRRYLAMDVILPYVAWITLLAFLLDRLLRALQRGLFPWYQPGSRA